MNVIVYADGTQEMEKTLEQLAQGELPTTQIETISSIEHLSQKLCRPLNGISVIIIFINSDKQIEDLSPLKPLLDNTRLILVLPNSDNRLVAKGLELNPCFVSYLDNDLRDIISVLKKIEQLVKGRQS